MEFAVLVDLAFDLCRVVGLQIGLVFVPDSRGLERLERLAGCQTIWPVLGVFVRPGSGPTSSRRSDLSCFWSSYFWRRRLSASCVRGLRFF